MISLTLQQIWEIVGLIVLSAFGIYAIKLVTSLRTGMLAKGWRHVTIGAIFLISAQFPFLASGFGSTEASSLDFLGMTMRFMGVIFLIIGLRAQCKVWRPDKSIVLKATPNKTIER